MVPGAAWSAEDGLAGPGCHADENGGYKYPSESRVAPLKSVDRVW